MTNYIQPQGVVAPMPQQVQPQQVQQVQPQQAQPQAQSINFYGGVITPQDGQLINQILIGINNSLGLQLNDQATVFKSLYFGARDMFKTLFVNQIAQQRGDKPSTPDYEKAQQVFEGIFGTVSQPKVNEQQLCLVMKAIAPSLLPNLNPNGIPHESIMHHILSLNWHSQNVRQNSNGTTRSSNSNNGSNPVAYGSYPNPFGDNQSKAAAAANIVNSQQPVQPAPMQAVYTNPQQAAQAVMGSMPAYT
ncbi:MAG: hypothetical protein RLZZ381_2077 [Cyanobacteriota bacterium]|jgi:hypothetical protein